MNIVERVMQQLTPDERAILRRPDITVTSEGKFLVEGKDGKSAEIESFRKGKNYWGIGSQPDHFFSNEKEELAAICRVLRDYIRLVKVADMLINKIM